MPRDESPLEFPCDFPLKVFGRNVAGFRETALAMIRQHCELAADDAISEQLSREGRFVSLTVVVRAESRAQLDAIYTELTASPAVLMVL